MLFLKKGDLVTIDAGHNCIPDSGAVKYMKEDIANKDVVFLLKKKLSEFGVTVIDVTPYNKRFSTHSESLKYRVVEANKYKAKLHICQHFNAGGGTGSEVWIYSTGGNAAKYANQTTKKIADAFGWRNRGVKVSGNSLYVPKATKAPCILIEGCFVDSKSDVDKYNAEKMANAIYEGLTGIKYSAFPETSNPSSGNGVVCNSLNASITMDIYPRDENGNILGIKKILNGERVGVLDVNHEKGICKVNYPSGNKDFPYISAWMTNSNKCIRYDNSYKKRICINTLVKITNSNDTVTLKKDTLVTKIDCFGNHSIIVFDYKSGKLNACATVPNNCLGDA